MQVREDFFGGFRCRLGKFSRGVRGRLGKVFRGFKECGKFGV